MPNPNGQLCCKNGPLRCLATFHSTATNTTRRGWSRTTCQRCTVGVDHNRCIPEPFPIWTPSSRPIHDEHIVELIHAPIDIRRKRVGEAGVHRAKKTRFLEQARTMSSEPLFRLLRDERSVQVAQETFRLFYSDLVPTANTNTAVYAVAGPDGFGPFNRHPPPTGFGWNVFGRAAPSLPVSCIPHCFNVSRRRAPFADGP